MNTRGFTLIELVIVIVLLGILSATTLPRYVDSSDDARRAVNNSTVAALNTALSSAIVNAQLPGTLFPYASLSSITQNIMNLDNNPNKATNNYLGFYVSSSKLILSAVLQLPYYSPNATVDGILPTSPSYYADLNGLYYNGSISWTVAPACTGIFNTLLANPSVQAGSTAATSYTTQTDATVTTGITTINGMSASTFNSSGTPQPVSVNFAYASGAYSVTTNIISVGTLNNGGCVYKMNNTANKKFYIMYDAIGMIFYTGEI